MGVLVYKTNINHAQDVDRVKPYFDDQAGIQRWNVDVEDSDKVLRVEAESDISETIVTLVQEAGFQCVELD